ncbi:MAG: DUF1854 domain-containing protein [Clostridia bacterium]|nr:DUF1854 domain-containing protein [Clostridia bacterium]
MMQDMTFEYLDPGEITLSVNSSGFCSMIYASREYKRVELLRAYPLSEPFRYICVEDTDHNEIGIIEDVSMLDEKSGEVARTMLERRYFTPEITGFIEITLKPGTTYFDCMFGDREKSFVVRDVSHNVFYIGENVARINDADGNRYVVHLDKLDKKSRKKIEPLLY